MRVCYLRTIFFLKEEVSDCHSVTSGLPSVTSTAEPEVQQVAGSSTRTSVGPALSTKTPEVSDFMYGNRRQIHGLVYQTTLAKS